jgi:DNA-binding beta-propeller fold protein YncE
MKKLIVFILLILSALVGRTWAQTMAPLTLSKQVTMPQVSIKGPGSKNFDALTANVKTNRLFIAAEWHGSVEVYNLKTNRLIHSITGIGRPLDILYLEDLDRLYVTDGTGVPTSDVGNTGVVRIYDGTTYKQIRRVDLLPDTDAIEYDPDTEHLFVKNGGEDAKQPYSVITILETNGDKVGEIKVDSDTIGDLVVEHSSSRLFVPDADKQRHSKLIQVFDRNKRRLLATWPDPHGTHDGVMDLDDSTHRLFAGEPEGLVTVFNAETGKEVTTLPIGKGMDGMVFDEKSKRLYVTCGDDGQIYVYKEEDPDHYKLLGKVFSGPNARGGTLVPELHRFFTAVPEHDNVPAELLVYQVQ